MRAGRADTVTRVPRTEAESQQLLMTRPTGWEFLHFAARLLRERAAVEGKYRDFVMGYAPPTDEVICIEDAPDLCSSQSPRDWGPVGRSNPAPDPCRYKKTAAQGMALRLPGQPEDPAPPSNYTRIRYPPPSCWYSALTTHPRYSTAPHNRSPRQYTSPGSVRLGPSRAVWTIRGYLKLAPECVGAIGDHQRLARRQDQTLGQGGPFARYPAQIRCLAGKPAAQTAAHDRDQQNHD